MVRTDGCSSRTWPGPYRSVTIPADDQGVSTTTPRTAAPRGTAFRAALLLAAAGTVLAGCGRATEPVASHQSSDSVAGVPAAAAVPPDTTSSAPTGVTQAPPTTPSSGAEASPMATRPAAPAPAPVVAAVTVAPEDLAGIDRSLTDIDTQLDDAGQDAATPEGDLG
jgi:hypothetical protein